MGRPKGSKNLNDNGKAFAERVEALLRKAGQGETLERLACRMMVNKKNPQTAVNVWQKVVAYKYGDPKQSVETKHNISIELTVQDADALIRSYFAITTGETDRASEGDPCEAAQQNHKLLPS